MKLVAKGTLESGYWAFGRRWPRLEAIEVVVSDDEGRCILADPNIVAIVVPEPESAKQKAVKA